MFVEIVLLSGALYGCDKLYCKAKKMLEMKEKKIKKKFGRNINLRQLVRDIRSVIKDEERQRLQLDIDPEQRKELKEIRVKNRRKMHLFLAATGLALLGSVSLPFAVAGAAAVLYLSEEIFSAIRKDFMRGHYLNIHLIALATTIIMIVTGHLALAAFSGVMFNFFAGIINRLEDDSQQQLVSVFSGHPEQVWLLRDGVEVQVDFHTLRPGDIVIVNAGEVIPVDGCIQSGEGMVDQHLFTGESCLVEKSADEEVFASTLLLSGRLEIEVTMAGNATVAAKIGNVLNQTQSYKDTLMNRGQELADRFIPVTLGLSGITLLLLGPTAAIAVMWSKPGVIMAPAGSLTVLSYLQILSRRNILIKDGRILESLRKVDTVVFDKTGTLTFEQPTVGAVHVFGDYDQNTVLRYAAAAEYRQPHPVARAIIARAEAEQLVPPEVENAACEVGYGIRITVESRIIRVGSTRFLQAEGIELPEAVLSIRNRAETAGYSLIYVGIDNQLGGILEIHPTIRSEAAGVIQYLKQRGIRICIISGDNEGPTRTIAENLEIEQYFSEVLPENKADHVSRLKEEGCFVCFVGDGVNDAIALRTAHISVSLKGASTAATDTAQIILMDGSLNNLEPLFEFADEFEESMQWHLAISLVPGAITIAGVYLLHFSIAAGMGIFYLSCFADLVNVLWPLAKHQDPREIGKEV